MEPWRLFILFATIAILGTFAIVESSESGSGNEASPVEFQHQPRQINFFKWLFGDGDTQRQVSANVTTTTTTPSSRELSLTTTKGSSVSGIPLKHSPIEVLDVQPLSLNDRHNGEKWRKNLSTNGSRAGKQMLVPEVEEGEGGTHSVEMEEQQSEGAYYQEEEPMDVVDDETLSKLQIPLKAAQVDRISVEVDPASDEAIGSSDIEDYDSSRDDGEEAEPQSQQNEVGITRTRKSRAVSLPSSNCDGIECLHSSILGRRRPASRGRIDGVDITMPRDNFTNIPILSPSSTPSPVGTGGSSTTTTLPTTSTTLATLIPVPSPTINGASTVTPLPNPNVSQSPTSPLAGSAPSLGNVSAGNVTSTTTQLLLMSPSPSPQTTESTSMSSVASSYTPSQAPLVSTTVTMSMSSVTPGMVASNGSSPHNSVVEGTSSKPVLPTMSSILSCQCGTQSISTEKGGGSTTLFRIMTHPWLVQISSQHKHLCAGSVINDRYILTAASCVDMYQTKNLRITAGSQLRSPKVFSVRKVALHPKYDPTTFANDIALLRLSEIARPSRYIRPICLPLGHPPRPHPTAHLVTWLQSSGGRRKGGIKRNRNLQLLQTEVELLNSTTCQNKVTAAVEGLVISNGTLCTTPPAQQKCGGDIGGVLQAYAGKFSYEQLGLVSLSVGCRANDLPGIFTDVRHYLRWILFQTQDAHYCREPQAHGRRFHE